MYVIKINQIGQCGAAERVGVGVGARVGGVGVGVGVRDGVGVGVGARVGVLCCVSPIAVMCCVVLCCDVVSWLVCACFSVQQHMDFSNPYPTR